MKLNAPNGRQSGPFGPIFELSASLNPHVFNLPLSIKKQSHSEQSKVRDAKDMEFPDLLKAPEKALARYAADETSDTRRRRGVRILRVPSHFLPYNTIFRRITGHFSGKSSKSGRNFSGFFFLNLSLDLSPSTTTFLSEGANGKKFRLPLRPSMTSHPFRNRATFAISAKTNT